MTPTSRSTRRRGSRSCRRAIAPRHQRGAPVRTRADADPSALPQREGFDLGIGETALRLDTLGVIGSSASPLGVSDMPRARRSNSATPNCCSSCWMLLVSAGWLMASARAAALRLPSRATARKWPQQRGVAQERHYQRLWLLNKTAFYMMPAAP